MFLRPSNRQFPKLGVISTLSIIALLCFQLYWLYNAYRNTRDAFVEDAHAALQEACTQEQALQKEAQQQKMEQVAMYSNTTLQHIQSAGADSSHRPVVISTVHMESSPKVDLQRIDSLFRRALKQRGLHTSYRLEATPMGTHKDSVRTLGERQKGPEIKITADNIQLIYFNAGQVMSINMGLEQVTAYLRFTPFVIFRQMFWILAVSVLLFVVIFYCLLSQLRVISRQKTAAAMKNDFIANFTHELKTPIAVVYAALDNIERNPGQVAQAVDAGKTQLKRLSDSVEKILSLSVEDNHQPALHREETELSAWLSSLVAPFRLHAGKQVVIELRLDPPQLKAAIDKMQMAQALNNIIDNAVKYAGNEVHIHIRCRETARGLRIEIQDNGTGINAEDRKKIFDRFYRIQHTAGKVKGFGLGLNYARTIVERHGGAISVESEPGKGSTFIIEL